MTQKFSPSHQRKRALHHHILLASTEEKTRPNYPQIFASRAATATPDADPLGRISTPKTFACSTHDRPMRRQKAAGNSNLPAAYPRLLNSKTKSSPYKLGFDTRGPPGMWIAFEGTLGRARAIAMSFTCEWMVA